MARLLVYRWPKHVRPATTVWTVVGALALVAFAVYLTDRPPTCGGVVMHASDECVVNGSVASYSDIAGSPLPSVVFALAVGLVGWLVLYKRKQNKPTKAEVLAFEKYATARRQELGGNEQLLAAFDQQLERERKRKHYHVNPTTTTAGERGPLPDLPG